MKTLQNKLGTENNAQTLIALTGLILVTVAISAFTILAITNGVKAW